MSVWGQDAANGKSSICGTICLDHSGSHLVTRLSNVIWERARAGEIHLPGFPAFEPIIQALKAGANRERNTSYRVTVQRHDTLYVLESFARKWLDDPMFHERALEIIKQHNTEYGTGEDGDFVVSDRIGGSR